MTRYHTFLHGNSEITVSGPWRDRLRRDGLRCIDKLILELLKITSETGLDISTDGERLIITLSSGSARKRRIATAWERTLAARAHVSLVPSDDQPDELLSHARRGPGVA